MIPFIVLALARGVAKTMQENATKERAQQQKLAAAAADRRAAIERAKWCCSDCGVEVAPGVAFCHSCGEPKMITRGEFLDRQAEEKSCLEKEEAAKRAAEHAELNARAARAQEEREQRRAAEQYREAAVRRCREVLSWRYCEPCYSVFEANHKFCTRCGTSTQELPRTFALEYAQNDYPDLIKSQSDFDRLF